MQIDTDTVDSYHNHTITDTAAKVTITPTEHVLGHTIGNTGDITGVVHADHTQTLIHDTLTMTPHIEGHPLREAHQLTHENAADHGPNQDNSESRKPCIKIHHIQEEPKVIHTLREIQELP